MKADAARVLRIMPNTPAAVGAGVILYSPGKGVTVEDEGRFLRLMEPAGICVKLPEEKIEYVLRSESGPDHNKTFVVEVRPELRMIEYHTGNG